MVDKQNRSGEFDASLVDQVCRRHLLFGWWALSGFVLLGLALEGLHGFKVDWYLDSAYETRRLLWRLAHAHGTLLAIVQLGFAFTIPYGWKGSAKGLLLTSTLFLLAALLLPLGFFLGGIKIYGGDPGIGIFLAPVGGFSMLLACLSVAWKLTFGRSQN